MRDHMAFHAPIQIFERYVIGTMMNWGLFGDVGNFVLHHSVVYTMLRIILKPKAAVETKTVHNTPTAILSGHNFIPPIAYPT